MSAVTRRRVITILAAAPGLPLLAAPVWSRAGTKPDTSTLRSWTGVALGADARLLINHPDPAVADALIRESLAEVARLERIFSLYRPDSALVRLNQTGVLEDAPSDLVALMAQAIAIAHLTGGAFDPTVQPLWAVYADHFSQPGADPAGPAPAALADALSRVGYAAVRVDADHVALLRPGMALTLNGIAQGYITDRVVALLKARGVDHTLVDMGEIRALGSRPDGRPWSAGIRGPQDDGRTVMTLMLTDQALSTSGAYGTPFEATGRFNHLFNPATGGCADPASSITVQAPTATLADALSTAFSVMTPDAIGAVLSKSAGCAAWRACTDGTVVTLRV